jgi:UPF0716 family protein affecting phage T7 exclusion
MFKSTIRSISYHLNYYTEGVIGWWDNIGLNDYLLLLIGAFVLGIWLLRSDPMKTL